MTLTIRITPWPEGTPPSESDLRLLMEKQGLEFNTWSNGPFDVYAPHAHNFNKVIYCVRGSITFRLVKLGLSYKLSPGDRLDLPPRTLHAAEAGPQGVVCFEAHT